MKMKPHRKIRSMQLKIEKAMKFAEKVRNKSNRTDPNDIWARLSNVKSEFDRMIIPVADKTITKTQNSSTSLSSLDSLRLGFELARDHETVTYYESNYNIAIFWSEESEAKIEKMLIEFEEAATPFLNEATVLEVHES